MMTRNRQRRLMNKEPIQEVDLISELPDPIIQHIMSSLPYKDAARMSILSKRFASAWTSSPTIIFDETLNMGSCLELTVFACYVGEFLSRRRRLDVSLEKFSFCFCLNNSSDQQSNVGIENAISYAIENNVKELELDVVGKRFKLMATYSLPIKVLSAHSIIVLSLKGFMLEPPQNLALDFPSIKELRLEKCKGMQKLSVSSQSLKIVVLEFCRGLEKVEIDAPNLESFSFGGGANSSCSVDVTACISLEYLSLKNAEITDEWIKHEIPKFIRLEVFKVGRCRLLRNFHVSNANLKTLEISDCSNLQKIEIYSRSLNTFVYGGQLMPSRVFIYSPSFHAKVSLSVDDPLPHDWFSSLRDFLSCFDHCKELEIACSIEMALIFPIDSRDSLLPPLYDLKYLKVVGKFPAKSEDLVDLVDGNKQKSLKFEYDIAVAIDEDLQCCYSMPIKCWRHSLKKVTVENFDDRENTILQRFFSQKAIRLEAISREDNGSADALAEEGVSQDYGSVITGNIEDLEAAIMANFLDDSEIY
uniref:F-box domain-containing protein n=1 Tax=Salix viminalis TaxID=40686 RepID=A0A6N2M2C3_SALVM